MSSRRLFEKPGSSWPPSGSTWTSTATRLAGCTCSAPSASLRLLAAQLGTGPGLVQLGARRPQRRETFSRASARPRDAARQPWGSFFVSFPVRSPTPALAVGPKLLGVGPPRSFRSSRAPGRWSLASSACVLQRGTGSGRFGFTASCCQRSGQGWRTPLWMICFWAHWPLPHQRCRRLCGLLQLATRRATQQPLWADTLRSW